MNFPQLIKERVKACKLNRPIPRLHCWYNAIRPHALAPLTKHRRISAHFTGFFFRYAEKFLILKANKAGGKIYQRIQSPHKAMKYLHFSIDYHTHWGEQLVLRYALDKEPAQTAALSTHDGTLWEGDLSVPDDAKTIRHRYAVVNENGEPLREETNSWRLFYMDCHEKRHFIDVWTEEEVPEVFHRAPFSPTLLFPSSSNDSAHPLLALRHLLLLYVPPTESGKKWFVTGNTNSLGAWDETKAVALHHVSATEWSVGLTDDDVRHGFQYKYLLFDEKCGTYVWESGENRVFPSQCSEGVNAVRMDMMPRQLAASWRCAGVVVPVFSLRSQCSMGSGDFHDLQTFVRWAAEAGMKAVQLLPINDTTTCGSWRDSYPYNSMSVFALHPIYIAPSEWTDTKAYRRCKAEGEELNALPTLDYERTYALKQRFLHELYKEIGEEVTQSAAYADFVREEAYWLDAYAAFCTLRTFHHTPDFRAWPDERTDAYGMEEDMTFHKFTQYLLHRQMLAVHETARLLGVMLKGDIPIGVSPDSVPAWKDERLFHFDGTAGAPPDDFAVNGQNWGFPTYNWEEMSHDNYAWWRKRLAHMSAYFDAYRIDHVLGFFRIWEVPRSQIYGTLGHFRPSLPLSAEEVRHYGFTLPPEEYAVPAVRRNADGELCPQLDDDTLEHYFESTSFGYVLKEKYRSQRVIEVQPVKDEIRKLLLDVVADVLFVRDPDAPTLYHPRVCAQHTHAYALLPQEQKEAFDRLHNDFFYFRHNDFWETEAWKKLPAVVNYLTSGTGDGLYPLESTGMLPCAEDLGMVPSCVKGVLEKLQVLSLEIQRMPKTWGHRFAPLSGNPYLSVSTIATHDMPPFRLWWKENAEQTQAFWHEVLGHEGNAPEEATPEVCAEVVKAHLASPSMLCLLSLQDWLALSTKLRSPYPETEQINVPANPNQYWNYRMHLSLEDLIHASGFNEKIRALLHQTGRA